jgi:hypothetical protein
MRELVTRENQLRVGVETKSKGVVLTTIVYVEGLAKPDRGREHVLEGFGPAALTVERKQKLDVKEPNLPSVEKSDSKSGLMRPRRGEKRDQATMTSVARTTCQVSLRGTRPTRQGRRQ